MGCGPELLSVQLTQHDTWRHRMLGVVFDATGRGGMEGRELHLWGTLGAVCRAIAPEQTDCRAGARLLCGPCAVRSCVEPRLDSTSAYPHMLACIHTHILTHHIPHLTI